MPLPDICINAGNNEDSAAIGLPGGVGGGIGEGGTITPEDGISYPGVIGNMPCNRPVIAGVTEQKRKYTIQFKYANDLPVDLTNVTKVMFYAKETYDAINYYVEKECSITDAAEGMITLKLKASNIPYSGVWWAGFHMFDSSNTAIAQYDVYLYVEKSLTSANRTNNTITISEVRMALLDRCPADNSLLDDIEFSDAEIAFAIRRPVDEWNERPPRILTYQYTTATFPYRYYWTNAASGELLKMAANNLIRNKMNYQAGGVSIEDKSRAPIYVQLAKELHLEYLEWMILEKTRLNAESIYGGVKTITYY